MKKLFLRDGKLLCNEFPEIPPVSFSPNQDAARMRSYNRSVESTVASAIEVVDFDVSALILNGFVCEDDFYSLPEGWTVKIGYQFETVCGPLGKEWNDFSEPQEANYNQHKKLGRIVRKIARLIPQEINDQERIDRCHGFTPFISPKQSGIAAIGKGWEGEKFSLLRDQETIATTGTGGIPDSRETANTTIDRIGELYEGLKDLHHGMLMYDKSGEFFAALQELRNIACVAVKSVSPPPQESVINLEALKRICYHFAGIVAPGWQPNAGSAFDTEWDEWLSTGKIVDWHQHPDDSKEVVKVEDLTRKP